MRKLTSRIVGAALLVCLPSLTTWAQVEPSDADMVDPVQWKSRSDAGEGEVMPQSTDQQPAGETLGEKMTRFGQGAASGLGSFFTAPEIESFWDLLHDHLEIGLRLTDNDLDAPTRPADPSQRETFLGFINELNQEDDGSAVLHVTILLNQYIGFEWMAEDSVSARTMNFNNRLSDGVLEASGSTYGAVVRYPIRHEKMTWVEAITP